MSSSLADATSVPSADAHQVLQCAHRLDRFERQIERYLLLQLQRLEDALQSFEQERTAWERQRDHEVQQLDQLRRLPPVRDMRGGSPTGAARLPVAVVPAARERRRIDTSVEQPLNVGGSGPLRILLQCGSASAMQLGLLMFEISKLNREVGGDGVRFEVHGCRRQRLRKRILSSAVGPAASIVELEVFSCAPVLFAAGEAAGVDHAETLHGWERFKSLLLTSSISDAGLESEFRKGEEVPRDDACRVLATEAARRADNANTHCDHTDNRFGPIYRPGGDYDAVRQQLRRLENITACLTEQCGLRIRMGLV